MQATYAALGIEIIYNIVTNNQKSRLYVKNGGCLVY